MENKDKEPDLAALRGETEELRKVARKLAEESERLIKRSKELRQEREIERVSKRRK
jgi:hypothetical protein